jgi:ArsR family transcriptional regulator
MLSAAVTTIREGMRERALFSYLRNYASACYGGAPASVEPSKDAHTVDLTAKTLDHYRLHAEICRVLADPKRLMVLDTLRAGECSVGELAAAIGTTLPNASQHLAVLRTAGLVRGVRSGTTVTYRLAEPAIIDACDTVHGIVTRRLAEATHPATEHADAAAILATLA